MNFEDSRVENICCHQQMVTGVAASPGTSKPLNSVNTGNGITVQRSDGGNTQCYSVGPNPEGFRAPALCLEGWVLAV